MNRRPEIEEQYENGTDVLNFVVYKSTTGLGNDSVRQHKILGITESAHITLHPDGTVNLHVKRSKETLIRAVRTGLAGYNPEISPKLKQFLEKIRQEI